MFIKSKNFSDKELGRFQELQRLSFSILEATAAELREGQTEKEVGRLLVRRYRDAGVSGFFHLPVVLYAERTALPGDWTIGKFFPKERGLQAGDSVILDTAPLFDGYMVDTSYSFCFGEVDAHREMMKNLSGFRQSVLDAINAGENFNKVAVDVANSISSMGYEPVHTKHPGEVLGHRALKTVNLPFTWRIKGFDGLSLGWFIYKSETVKRGISKRSPLWNEQASSDHEPHDGLWMVEPHAGQGAIGAKWEEILVIQGGKAWWLDAEPPHVRQWAQIDGGVSYAPRGSLYAGPNK